MPLVSGLLSRPLRKLDLEWFHFHNFIYTRGGSTPTILPYLIPLAVLCSSACWVPRNIAGPESTLHCCGVHCPWYQLQVFCPYRCQEKDWGKDAEGFSKGKGLKVSTWLENQASRFRASDVIKPLTFAMLGSRLSSQFGFWKFRNF